MRLSSSSLRAPVLPDNATKFGMTHGPTLSSAGSGEEGSAPPLFDSSPASPISLVPT